jgi:hypothetical protein
MPKHMIAFETHKHHIHLECFITDLHGTIYSIDAILDTGAPRTECSDQFLVYAEFLESRRENAVIPPGLQTRKYGRVTLPMMTICGHELTAFEVSVSSFEASWGIDALIGLDFFRRFLITIDYSKGLIMTESYQDKSDIPGRRRRRV